MAKRIQVTKNERGYHMSICVRYYESVKIAVELIQLLGIESCQDIWTR